MRPILDRKQWEMLPTQSGGVSGGMVAASTQFDQYQLWVSGTASNAISLYDPRQDSAMTLAASGMSTFSATAGSGGGAVCYHPSGPTGTASAGSATTITTVTNLPGSMAGYTIRITGGTGAGQERTVSGNTYGANSVVTVSSSWSVTPDATSTYLLLTGRFWVFNGSTTVGLRYYDIATNTWSAALTVTGVTAAGNTWRLVSTPAFGNTIASGTATAGAASTLTNSGKAWTVNQWTNYQVRITGGTGAGQVRTVASNTGTVLTVSSTWGTNPDATSVYVVEPNDDFLYALGGGAVTLYRYSISGNAWSTLTPGVARTAAAGASCTASWIGVASDATWADETNIKNGRYIYSFQGGGSGNLSYYDIATNTWINETTTYQRGGGGFAPTASSNLWSAANDREFIYVGTVSIFTNNLFYRYNCVTRSLDPWATWVYPLASLSGSDGFTCVTSYTDGGTTIRWLYLQAGAGNGFFRMMII